MSYEKQIWEELPSEETPFSAERMNHIEEGIDSKLNKMVVSKQLNTAGWYRVAKYNSTGAVAKSFLFNVNTVYSNTNNISATILVNVTNTKARLTNISTLVNSNVIDKVRIVQENNICYLEIHYTVNVVNPVKVDILNQNDWNLYDLNNIDVTMLNFEAPTDIATVLDEIDIEPIDTGWITLNKYIQYRKKNGVVYICGYGQNEYEIGDGSYTTVGTLPNGFRPRTYTYFAWSGISSDVKNQSGQIYSNTGNIGLFLPKGQTISNWGFTISFPV